MQGHFDYSLLLEFREKPEICLWAENLCTCGFTVLDLWLGKYTTGAVTLKLLYLQ